MKAKKIIRNCKPFADIKSQHTPTPWKQTGRKVSGGEYQAETIGVSLSGQTSKPYMTTAHELMFTVRKEEDAAFIVQAVNCHEELIETLRFVSKTMNQHDGYWSLGLAAKVEDAIAKAEGK